MKLKLFENQKVMTCVTICKFELVSVEKNNLITHVALLRLKLGNSIKVKATFDTMMYLM